MFTWAIEQELLTESPFRRHGVTRIKKTPEEARDRRLEGDEEARLLRCAGHHLGACIMATLETGMRKGEVLGLTWQHVHLESGLLSLPGTLTKTGKPRQVVITPRLEGLLREWRLGPNGQPYPQSACAFGTPTGTPIRDIRTAWHATCRRADITGLHCTATDFLDSRVSVFTRPW